MGVCPRGEEGSRNEGRVMRIVFDVTSCVKEKRGGIGNYGWDLVEACHRVAPEHEYALAVRSNRWIKRGLIEGLLPSVPRRLIVGEFPRLTLGRRVDVFHSIGVRLPVTEAFPKVVSLHDINVFEFPELSTPEWREKRQRRIRQTIERADLVLSASEQGACVLGEYLDVPRERIRVVPYGVNTAVFSPPDAAKVERVLTEHELKDRPYILNIGAHGERKNQAGLLRAFVRANLPQEWRLAFGGLGKGGLARLREDAERLGVSDRVLFLGWIPAEDLPALIGGAGFYCCSSLHEGFGIPIIEAQACGCPVVSSNRGALCETLGDCGLSFDPEDEDAFAASIAKMAADEALRCELAQRGPERVRAHFTLEKVATGTLAVLEEAARMA